MKVKEMKNKMKNKVKIWIKDHSEEIILDAVVAVAGVGVGVWFGNKIGANKVYRDKTVLTAGTTIEAVVKSVANTYQEGCLMFGLINAKYTPDQLGELGKQMINSGAPCDKNFTHFIAVGPGTEEN